MNAVGRIGSYIYRGVGTVSGPFHPFGGAIDIIVVQQPDGSFKSSPCKRFIFSALTFPQENGYQLMFLSARAISQASITRQFLVNLKQDGKALPDGPVVISPDGVFPSLYREVIRRAPHEFKISCLVEIRALFPPEHNPFYAGFGNRNTDEISYLEVGIPRGKIFTINPKGQVAVNRRVDTRSYTNLHALVNGMFPATTTSSEREDFNTWNFWKLPPPSFM
ncbi:hypothetical protein F2Q70_00001945 [Brassica cretica]|uniref:LNS2/PITP domain-containing protein n=1 Tax=Brassica cretica TaxID=69181 RepID=A0A8S9IM25_BRACR|nr:hypothetical protein F2Q70_00001945 [Brassica cretica]